MLNSLLADLILLVHALFILFVIAGGLLVLYWRWIAWLHIPCVIWGALLEINHWICPLTPLENKFRNRAGEEGYAGGFINHYLEPIIYPGWLTPTLQVVLGVLVVLLNVAVYAWVIHRREKSRWLFK